MEVGECHGPSSPEEDTPSVCSALVPAPLRKRAVQDTRQREQVARAQAKEGRAALMVAAFNGHESTVKVLLEKGADHAVKEKNNGVTALILAAQEGPIQLKLQKYP